MRSDENLASFLLNISTIHLHILRIIYDCRCIDISAEIESFEMQKNCKKIKSEHA